MSLPTDEASDPKASLLWLDLEFTGLDVNKDVVVEAGLIATDYRLKKIAQFTSFVNYPINVVTELMDQNPWWLERPEHRAIMLEGVQDAAGGLSEVASEVARFAREWCTAPVVLSGNSIYNDRKWVDRDFPELSGKLHYRMIDVSTIKLLAQGMMGVEFIKNENHRALDDVKESIDELKFLLGIIGNDNLRSVFGD